MATAFMKWLERRPALYDRGIRWLTFFRLATLQRGIAEQYATPGVHALEIGCGTGALTAEMAQRGAEVVAIDFAASMLAQAEIRLAHEGLLAHVSLKLMDATEITDLTDDAPFDLIVSSLAFSEMTPPAQAYILRACRGLLAPEGRVVILDESTPSNPVSRFVIGLIRLPLRFLTWVLTRATTQPLSNFPQLKTGAGYDLVSVQSSLGGALKVWVIRPAARGAGGDRAVILGRLQDKVTLRTRLIDLWALFLRIIPPYPKIQPGLYTVGEPDGNAPLLVTGNFELTVRRLVHAIDGKLDAWVLVADSAGINVWCAAGGGFLTAEKIIGALHMSGADSILNHRAMILPELCANGVDGWKIRRETGWGVHWGPIKAKDIPAYLREGRKKTDAMRWVSFPLKDRLEMVTVTLGFYGLLLLVPIAIFWRGIFFPAAASLLGVSYFYAVFMPWIPGRDGLAKAVPLSVITLLGLSAYTLVVDPVSPYAFFKRALGILAMSIFTSAELQGMSPLMRGEQANWIWEGVIAGILSLVYWLVPSVLGWR